MEEFENKRLLFLLNELRKAVENLLLSGLTAASKSTMEWIDVSMKEASHMKLLRLSSTLRIANEEISRFITGSNQFSVRRLAFFLSRAWILSTAMIKAINKNDNAMFQHLLAIQAAQSVEKLKVVIVGISKRVILGAFASFDFRLRAIGIAGPVADKEPMIWSCVFPLRKDLDLPAEAFLHLPQKQKFKPLVFIEKNIIDITNCAATKQLGSATRLVLNASSEIKSECPFTDWESVLIWDIHQSALRLENHQPTPTDLEIELQEEVYISNWEPTQQCITKEGYDLLHIETDHLPFEMRLDSGPSGVPVCERIKKMVNEKNYPPIYGVAHYESCQLIFQPLSVISKGDIEYLTISLDKISQAELVKAMKFT